MSGSYAAAESELTYPGDDPGQLASYLVSVNDAREQLARLQDGLLDGADQLSACWASDAKDAADREVTAQVTAAGTALARVDAALEMVGGYASAVTTARSEVDALRVSWTGNLGAYDIAVAGGDLAEIEGCEDRFEDLGSSWRTVYERVKQQAVEVDQQLLQLTWGWSGAADSLAVAVGIDRLVMDDPFAATGAPGSLSAIQTEYLAADVPTSVTPSLAFPLADYRAAVAAAVFRDPAFGKAFGAQFAACTDYACVLEAAKQYRTSLDLMGGATAIANAYEATAQPILEAVKFVTVGDCFEGNAADCAGMMFPVFNKWRKLIGWVEDASFITEHGESRLLDRSMGRFAIEAAMEGRVLLQRDGATVYVNETSPGRYTFIVVGDKGIVTSGRDWDFDGVSRTARTHGWIGWP